MAVTHNTFVVEKEYPKPPAKVFEAFSDIEKKKRWYAAGGSHEVVSYANDFRVGGREVMVGRMGEDTPIPGVVLTWAQEYMEIVAGRRIVAVQTLDMKSGDMKSGEGESRASVALVSIELEPASAGCKLTMTHQAVYFERSDGPQMRELGWRALLDALEGALA